MHIMLAPEEARLIRQALHEFVDPDPERQEMIANIMRKLTLAERSSSPHR